MKSISWFECRFPTAYRRNPPVVVQSSESDLPLILLIAVFLQRPRGFNYFLITQLRRCHLGFVGGRDCDVGVGTWDIVRN